MKRHEYIKKQAAELSSLCKKRERLSDRFCNGNPTHSQAQKLNAELNWCGMETAKTEERLAFALGLLLPENAVKEYRPSGFHVYPGIGAELAKIKFDH